MIEVRYADLRRPAISLWEQRAAVRVLRADGQRDVSERLVFKAIEEQRRLVARARNQTLRQRRDSGRRDRVPAAAVNLWPSVPPAEPGSLEVDYSKPAPGYLSTPIQN